MRLDRKRKKIIFAMILGICVIMIGSKVFGKYHSEQKAINRLIENPFSGINQEIDLQSGNYQGNTKALVVDGYVYFYKSRVYLGNYDHADELETVSYTHLDVYKRQVVFRYVTCWRFTK